MVSMADSNVLLTFRTMPDTRLLLLQELAPAGIAIAAIDHTGDENPVDLAWGADRPAPPHEAVRLHPMEYAGETVQEKLAKVGVPTANCNTRTRRSLTP